VRVGLGLFLLIAAGLKLHGLAEGTAGGTAFFASPALQLAVIEAEALIGLWLLSGWASRGAWIAALVLFTLLAAASLYLALTGQRSCGCLGRVTVSPWWMLLVDVSAIAALLIWRPQRGATDENTGKPRGESSSLAGLKALAGLKTLAGAAAILVILGGGVLFFFDTPAEALARLRGESVTVDPRVSDVGEAAAGEQRTFTIQLTNRTAKPIRVVGGTTSCACIATKDLPITLPPAESQEISVQIRFTGSAGRFSHRFTLNTDDDVQPLVIARFAGRVVESPSP
jgi:hypothetical protein